MLLPLHGSLGLLGRRYGAVAPNGPFGGHPTLGVGIESYWKLDEASGIRIDSVVASGNNLTDHGVGSAAGVNNLAAKFVKANSEYLSHADNASLSTGDIDFTFTTWVLLNNNNTRMTIIGKDAANGREYELNFNGTRFEFNLFDGVNTQRGQRALNNGGLPATATWYFVMAWHDSVANTINVQRGDQAAESGATSGAVGDGNAEFNLGRRSFAGNNNHLDGMMDETGFWKRVLTADERAALALGLFY